MTAAYCAELCADYLFFGTQYSSECFCGNDYGTHGVSSNCNMECSGDSTEICGGGYANSVYAYDTGSPQSKLIG